MDNETIKLIIDSQEGNIGARDLLVRKNLGLIWSIIKRFSNRGYETDDLFQIGCIGLLKAIEKFDLSFEVEFSTYAVPMIIGEIKRFIRDDGIIKVSRSLKELGNKARITREILNNKNGREPTIEEISKEIGVTSEEIVFALESSAEVESLYKTIYQGDGNPVYLLDKIKDLEDESETTINNIAIKEVLNQLSLKEREIIILRYFHNMTQSEIAKKIGISQVQVSRLEKKILENMKKELL